ncbi:MAG: class I SAM-dependent methyltransferase [Nocardioides sp.]
MTDAKTGQVTARAAELYEQFFVPALFDQWPRRLLDAAGVHDGHDVLDVACGTGVLARTAVEHVGERGSVTGLDLNDGMLTVASGLRPDITWVPGRAESMPFTDESFDHVFCQFGLMFFADRRAAVREMARVARRGSSISVATWAGLDETPGYAAMVQLLDELFGQEAADALTAPFTIGTPTELADVLTGIVEPVEVRRLEGRARFPSIDAWVATDVRAWTLRDLIDDAQFDDLLATARIRLRPFTDATGAVDFAAPALVARARR